MEYKKSVHNSRQQQRHDENIILVIQCVISIGIIRKKAFGLFILIRSNQKNPQK